MEKDRNGDSAALLASKAPDLSRLSYEDLVRLARLDGSDL